MTRGTLAPAPSQAAELFASTNGMLSIRSQLPDGEKHNGRPYKVTAISTSKADKGRKIFARFLTKHQIKGIDAETVDIQSSSGPITAAELKTQGLGTIMKQRQHASSGKQRRKAAAPKANGHAAPVADQSRIRDLIQVVGTSLASAATALRMLQEEIGHVPDDLV